MSRRCTTPRATRKCLRCEQLAALGELFCDKLCERAYEHEREQIGSRESVLDPDEKHDGSAWHSGMRLPLQNSA